MQLLGENTTQRLSWSSTCFDLGEHKRSGPDSLLDLAVNSSVKAESQWSRAKIPRSSNEQQRSYYPPLSSCIAVGSVALTSDDQQTVIMDLVGVSSNMRSC